MLIHFNLYYWLNILAFYITTHLNVVYFDQLLGAASSQKLAKIFFCVFGLFLLILDCFPSFLSEKKKKDIKICLKKTPAAGRPQGAGSLPCTQVCLISVHCPGKLLRESTSIWVMTIFKKSLKHNILHRFSSFLLKNRI